EQHLVDEPDDRRIFHIVASDRFLFELVIAASDFEVVEIKVVVAKRWHRRVDLLNGLVADALELVFLDDHSLDGQAGLEFDFVQGMEIRRVRHRHKQAFSALYERQDPVFRQKFVGDQLDRLEIGLNSIQVEQGNAEYLRGSNCDVSRVRETGRDEVGDQIDVWLFRHVYRL